MRHLFERHVAELARGDLETEMPAQRHLAEVGIAIADRDQRQALRQRFQCCFGIVVAFDRVALALVDAIGAIDPFVAQTKRRENVAKSQFALLGVVV